MQGGPVGNANISNLDPQAASVCALSGAREKLIKQLMTLEDCEKLLSVSIQETRKAANRERMLGHLILASKAVQAICDIAIWRMSQIPAVGVGGKAVSALYDVAKIVADSLTGEFNAKEGFKYSAGIHADAILAIMESRGSSWHKSADALKQLAFLADDLHDFVETKGSSVSPSSALDSTADSAAALLERIRQQAALVRSTLDGCDQASSGSMNLS